MKRMKLIVLGAAMMLLLAACGNKDAVSTESTAKIESTEKNSVGLANPFVTCSTLEEAAQTAGFEMTVPETVKGYEEAVIQAIENQLIQVIWQNGENKIIIRKGTGTDDISGNFNQYAQTEEVTVGDWNVTMKGSAEAVNVAVWTAGDYAYAVSAAKEGLSKDAMADLAAGIQ